MKNEVVKSVSNEVVKNEKLQAKPDFYLGLDDVTVFRGKKGDMKPVSKAVRFINQKFQSDPKRAAELVYLNQVYDKENRRATCDPEVIKDFWKHVHWDKESKMYVYEELLTIGTRQPPKKCQLEEYYKGNYEFYLLRHEIQVLKTELVKAC